MERDLSPNSRDGNRPKKVGGMESAYKKGAVIVPA